ncbi:hypothetical protein EON68_01435, partial [archaeon]
MCVCVCVWACVCVCVGVCGRVRGCRSGKSSIVRTVFSKMSPHETLFLGASTVPKVYTIATNPYMQFTIWDWPGEVEWSKPSERGAFAAPSLPSTAPVMGSSMSRSLATGNGLLARPLTGLTGTLECVVYDDPQDEVDGIGGDGMDAGMLSTQAITAMGGAVQTLTELEALSACSAIIFVIDASDDSASNESVEALRGVAGALMALARKRLAAASSARAAGQALPAGCAHTGIPGSTDANPFALPRLDVFIHKVDCDAFSAGDTSVRTDTMRDIGAQVAQELADTGFSVLGLSSSASSALHGRGALASGTSTTVPLVVSLHMTSIFDHSIFEAMSRVVQKVTPGQQFISSCENLLNSLQHVFNAEKVFLLDVVTKLYYATDSTPVQDAIYELCAEMTEVVVDVGCIYDPVAVAEANGTFDELPKYVRTAPDAGRCSTSLTKLSDGTTLYMREVAPYLAVVAVMKDPTCTDVDSEDDAGGGMPAHAHAHAHAHAEDVDGSDEVFEAGARASALPKSSLCLPSRALVDYNIRVFARALANIFAIKLGVPPATIAAAATGGPGAGLGSSQVGSFGGLPLSSSLSRSFN